MANFQFHVRLLWIGALCSLWLGGDAFRGLGFHIRGGFPKPIIQTKSGHDNRQLLETSRHSNPTYLQMGIRFRKTVMEPTVDLRPKLEISEEDEDNPEVPYTREEDQKIFLSVGLWDLKGEGLWEKLQEEMGRDAHRLRARWEKIAGMRRYHENSWSQEMDDQLAAAVAAAAPEGFRWANISSQLGEPFTTQGCRIRYLTYLQPLQQGKKVGEWSEEEIAHLTEIVEQLEVGEPIMWNPIATELQRAPLDCAKAWKGVMREKLRFERYSEKEDAKIIAMVKKFGTRTRCMWEKLQHTMGRNASSLRRRFYGVLFDTSDGFKTRDDPSKVKTVSTAVKVNAKKMKGKR